MRWPCTQYDPLTGTGDIGGGPNATGDYQLMIQALPVDTNDALAEAAALGAVTPAPIVVPGDISPDIDVDMYGFTVTAGMTVRFNIDTPLNGPGGLDSFLWVFDALGQPLSFNNNGAAPGEGAAVFDSYLEYKFATAGNYYVGVSNAHNTQYDPVTGNGDTAGGVNSIGTYQLTIQDWPVPVVPALAAALNVASIPEFHGSAIGTVSRTNADPSQPLLVLLASSDPSAATVPASVTIPANQLSATFAITAVDDHVVDGTDTTTITVSAAGFTSSSAVLQVTDSDGHWHNAVRPADVNNDGMVSAVDALIIINYLNSSGSGPVPAGNPPPFYDVNSDDFITAVDALMVINLLNAQPSSRLFQ